MFRKSVKREREDAVSYNALTLWAQIGWPVAIPNLDNAEDDNDDDGDDGASGDNGSDCLDNRLDLAHN